MPVDGHAVLAYDSGTNRITTVGYEYDAAGNQIKAPGPDGNGLLFEYDAAGRISVIRKESDNSLVQAFQYGSTNARLMDTNYGFGYLKLFASTGGTTLAEYTEFTASVPTWTKSYTYLGNRSLSAITPNGSGGEFVEFNHPDKLSTRLVTNQAGGTAYEQVHLPFGTALNAESSIADNPRRFTSYDRSSATGLDYALNRTYDSKQGRFTQVDPIGMKASELMLPQTLNLYSYCGNDPVNHTDPDGQFFFSVLSFLLGGLLGAAIASERVRKALFVAFRAIVTVMDNQWVQLGFFVLDFILPGISKVAKGFATLLSAVNKAYQTTSNLIGIAQIGALIVQKQWKQLGVSLGLAVALAPLTTIMAEVKKGIQTRLFDRTFDELADLFVGAWEGFKDGFRFFAEGLKRNGWKALIPFYGNRCGPDYGDGPGVSTINSYDKNVCGWHDDKMTEIGEDKMNYTPAGKRNGRYYRKKFFAEIEFFGRTFIYGAGPHAVDIAFGTSRPSLGARYKFLSFPAFGLRSVYFGFRAVQTN